MIQKLLICFLLRIKAASGVAELFRHDQDPLLRPFADAFSSRLAEVVQVKNPASVLVVNNSIIYVSSFLDDAVLFTNLPLTPTSKFRVFASGSYCTPHLRRCAILNGNISKAILRIELGIQHKMLTISSSVVCRSCRAMGFGTFGGPSIRRLFRFGPSPSIRSINWPLCRRHGR